MDRKIGVEVHPPPLLRLPAAKLLPFLKQLSPVPMFGKNHVIEFLGKTTAAQSKSYKCLYYYYYYILLLLQLLLLLYRFRFSGCTATS